MYIPFTPFYLKAALLITGVFFLVPAFSQVTLWGLTSSGGQGAGSIISMEEDGTNFSSVIFPFIEGKSPAGDLFKATNGKFYGMTQEGGINNSGVVFEYDAVSSTYEVLHHFETSSIPKGNLIESDDKLYGMTSGGGAFGYGVIFEYNLQTGNFTTLYEFGTNAGDGKSPEGSLIMSDGKLYGMTPLGGLNDYGTIFEHNPVTDIHTVVHSFNDIEGSYPYGSLLASGQSLLGLTSSGGTMLSGVMFEYNLVAGSIDILHHFDSGGSPFGSLITYNGKFYGMSTTGGDNFEGSIFEYDLLMGTYSDIFSFDNDAFGSFPFGSLVESAGKLYGMTNGGGGNFAGVLFEYAISSNDYNILHEFDPEITGGGASPLGSLIVSDGKLYGLTSSGSNASSGTLFEYNISGNTYNVKIIFENASTGSVPQGDLIRSGMNWYGLAMNGGNNNKGTIFKYDPDGVGTLSALHHFSGTDGSIPTGSLILFNGNLYGMTSEGGLNNGGVLFEYNLTTLTYSVMHNFIAGSLPKGSLLEWNGNFFGMTSNGGIGLGEIFMYNPSNSTFSSLHAFDGAEGNFPNGDLVQLNGVLYGMTTTSNTHPGVIFRFTPDVLTFDVLRYFSGGMNDGASPYGSLTKFAGNLYGMTRDGGSSDKGVIFKYDLSGAGTYSLLYEFNNTNGENPEGNLTVVGNNLYGMTKQGGSSGEGVIFKVDEDGLNFQVLQTLNQNLGKSPFGSLISSGCVNSVISTVSSDVNPLVCAGNTSILSVTGTLNGASEWKWYTSSCGGTLIGSGNTISVMPESSTTYFVRGEGGCAESGECSSIEINIVGPVVLNKNDSGSGSLRAAISCATDGGTIVFDPSVVGVNDTISITSAALEINKNIIIDQTQSSNVNIKATGQHPVFIINAGKSLSLNYVKLFTNPESPDINGRAIFNSGNLQISNTNIYDKSQNLSGIGSTIRNEPGSNVNVSSSNQIIIQN
ncbi:MAG: hypothetical protein IPM42_14490 [Saprospiraceae bacterium]|nr:hypothetical protein [Saprospiraceae bacterium]